jgi:hypothetical protein
MARSVKPQIPLLLDGLDEAFNRRSWRGTNLHGSPHPRRSRATKATGTGAVENTQGWRRHDPRADSITVRMAWVPSCSPPMNPSMAASASHPLSMRSDSHSSA